MALNVGVHAMPVTVTVDAAELTPDTVTMNLTAIPGPISVPTWATIWVELTQEKELAKCSVPFGP